MYYILNVCFVCIGESSEYNTTNETETRIIQMNDAGNDKHKSR